MLDRCPVRAPNHRTKGCQARDTVGDFRLEITPEIHLRDHMYVLQQTTEWKERYKIRAGIEATNSELKRAHGIGRLRVRRAAKVCFAVACKVIACNIKRWAKAHMTLKRTLQGCLSSFRVWVKLWSELIGYPYSRNRSSRWWDHHRGDNLIVSERALTFQGSDNAVYHCADEARIENF